MKKTKFFLLVAIFGFIILLTSCASNEITNAQNSSSTYFEQPTSIPTMAPTLRPKDKIATIVSFGDTLCHTQVFNSVYDSSKGAYDFSPMFKYVNKHFKDSDVNIGNLESCLAGKTRGYSGYPCFNAPEHLAIDLKELGVDIVTTANNHTLDKGYDGLSNTIKYLNKTDIKHVGTSRSPKEQNKILFKNLNGIKTAFLAYTYGTNGIPVPAGKEFCVNYINKALIKKHIKKAKKLGADCIVVSMHWGIEYTNTPTFEQNELARFLIQNGVNIVLGCHPHVLQPMKMIKVGNKKGLVIFSQGNFFSAQTRDTTRNTALFKIKIRKKGSNGKIIIDKASYVPLYVYDTYSHTNGRYKILDLNNIIKDYKRKNKGHWSNTLYQLALRERKTCQNIIGPKINNKK